MSLSYASNVISVEETPVIDGLCEIVVTADLADSQNKMTMEYRVPGYVLTSSDIREGNGGWPDRLDRILPYQTACRAANVVAEYLASFSDHESPKAHVASADKVSVSYYMVANRAIITGSTTNTKDGLTTHNVELLTDDVVPWKKIGRIKIIPKSSDTQQIDRDGLLVVTMISARLTDAFAGELHG